MSSRAALHALPDLDGHDEVVDGIRFYDVVSDDGTVLRAWTNDVEGDLARSTYTPTVLLCNGLGTNAWAWPALIHPDSGVRVVSWNHRGTGGSERPQERTHVGIDSFVEDAIAVMDHAGLDAVPVMGWSMGVNTAFELAYLHPERVTGLLAVAGVPGSTFSSMLVPLHVPRFARAALTVNAARAMRTLGKPLSLLTQHLPVGPLTAQVISHSGFMLPTPDLDNTRRAIKEFLTTPIDWYMHLAVETSRHVRVPLREIEVPTTFVAGTYDVLASAYDMWTAAQRMEDAEYVEYHASHFVPMECPDEVHEHLLDLLDRVADLV